jgi:tetratricopeptide (TPR) repeat protein
VLQRLGEAFRALGEFPQAAEVYAHLQRLLPANPQARERLTELYLQIGKRKEAAEQLQELLRESPSNVQANYLMGLIAIDDKQFPRAAEFLARVILIDPELENAYTELASVQLALDKPQEALLTLEKARARFRANFTLEFYSSLVQAQLKDHAKALRHLTAAETYARATERQRLTPQFYFQMGATLERNKNFAEAEKYFLLALKEKPDFVDALNYLGYMWVEQGGRLSEARAMIEKAVKAEPTNAAFLDSMAWVLFKLGKPREALDWQLRALKHLKEPDATLHDHLADIYLSLKQPGKAREHWLKSLAIEAAPAVQKKLDALPQ